MIESDITEFVDAKNNKSYFNINNQNVEPQSGRPLNNDEIVSSRGYIVNIPIQEHHEIDRNIINNYVRYNNLKICFFRVLSIIMTTICFIVAGFAFIKILLLNYG